MTAEARLRQKLMVALEPTRLDIVNESELHAGHRSSPNTGESHFRILIVSPMFAGVSRVGRHRMVNDAIAEDLRSGIHALALSTYAPGEALT
jgi:BolA protein